MTEKTICYCMNVSENAIIKAIKDGATTLNDIQKSTTACTGNRCKELNPSGKCCSEDIRAILKKEIGAVSKSECCCCH